MPLSSTRYGIGFFALLISASILHAKPNRDTLHYFDAEFDFVPGGIGIYHGIIRPVSKQYFFVTLFNRQQIKIADLHFAGRELSEKEGNITGYYPNGSIQFVGNYHNDNLDGPWKSYFPSGQTCDSGKMRNNAPEGYWMSWYPDGSVRMVAEFSSKRLKEMKEEMQRLYRPNITNSRSQSFTFGAYVFQQTIYKQINEAVNAEHIVGPGVARPINIKMEMNAEGNSYSPPFDQCIVHGLFKTYFPDGRLKDSGYYNSGYKNGIWREWNANLRLSGFYKNGKKRGEWKFYNAAGKYLYTRRYTKMGYEFRKQG